MATQQQILPDGVANHAVRWKRIQSLSPNFNSQCPGHAPFGFDNYGVFCYENVVLLSLLHIPKFLDWLDKRSKLVGHCNISLPPLPDSDRLAGESPDVDPHTDEPPPILDANTEWIHHGRLCWVSQLAQLARSFWHGNLDTNRRDVIRTQAWVPGQDPFFRETMQQATFLADGGQQDAHEYYLDVIKQYFAEPERPYKSLESVQLQGLFQMRLFKQWECPHHHLQDHGDPHEETWDVRVFPPTWDDRNNVPAANFELSNRLKVIFTGMDTEKDSACPDCHVPSTKLRERRWIACAPHVLVIHMTVLNDYGHKQPGLLQYEQEIDLEQYAHPSIRAQGPFKYRLCTVLCHTGADIASGHYTMYAKGREGWALIDNEVAGPDDVDFRDPWRHYPRVDSDGESFEESFNSYDTAKKDSDLENVPVPIMLFYVADEPEEKQKKALRAQMRAEKQRQTRGWKRGPGGRLESVRD